MDRVKNWRNSGPATILTEVLQSQTELNNRTKHEVLFFTAHGAMIESGMVPENAAPSKFATLPAWRLPNGDFKVTYKLPAAESRICMLWGHALGRFLIVYGSIVPMDTSVSGKALKIEQYSAGEQVARLCLDSAEFMVEGGGEPMVTRLSSAGIQGSHIICMLNPAFLLVNQTCRTF